MRELPARRELGPRRIDAWPLLIRSAVRADTEFVTDRGRRRLPAWRLDAADALGPIWVLDPDVDPAEYERYARGDVVESRQAVAVVPVGVDVGPPGARRAIGYMHKITVRLTEPLGARVYVDLHGNAGVVTSG